MFVDEVKVYLKAGKGGDGCTSFRRERYRPKGGPDGGDGGRGGDIILEGDENQGDLIDYKYKPQVRAGKGEQGRGNDKNGKSGGDCILPLPLGTVVLREATGQTVTEIVQQAQRVRLLEGGRGGAGNLKFKSSLNRAPRHSTPGQPGEEGTFLFILKTIADIGLVGFPNAGKSSLTNLITRAHPKAASYPFTTLQPTVGVIEYPEQFDRLLLADIPGLINGAHENIGLGHRFLRHIERCNLLLFMVDMAAGEGRDPRDDFKVLLNEMNCYNPELAKKPRLIAANKMDETAAPANLEAFREEISETVIPISCLTEEGIEELRKRLYRKIRGK